MEGDRYGQSLKQEQRFSRVPGDRIAMRLPSSCMSSTESWFHAPAVSTATGKKMSGGQRIIFDHFAGRCFIGSYTWFSGSVA